LFLDFSRRLNTERDCREGEVGQELSGSTAVYGIWLGVKEGHKRQSKRDDVLSPSVHLE
jgi:hypothetical protein